ncbi:MAG: methyl-accepting chemotaxis protein [Candidatus Symbiobacter sp.]|nr:methyl-accepting chemotaxis protein [Candidatus Symbiobacter sp.]
MAVKYIGLLYQSITNENDKKFENLMEQRKSIKHLFNLPDFDVAAYQSSRIERIRIILDEIERVKDASNINLDPEIGTNYAAEIISYNIPNVINSAHDVMVVYDDALKNQVKNDQVLKAIEKFSIDVDQAFTDIKSAKDYLDDANLAKSFSQVHKDLQSNIFKIQVKMSYEKESGDSFQLKPIMTILQSLGNSVTIYMEKGLEKRLNASWSKITGGIILGILGAIAACIFLLFIIKSVGQPISMVTDAMEKFANGDISLSLPDLHRRDEVGKMNNALLKFQKNLIEREHLLEEKRIHNKKEEQRAEALIMLNREFEQLTRESLQVFAGASEELNVTAQSMAEAAGIASQRSSLVVSAAEEISKNINSVATSSKGLVMALQQIGSQVETSQQTTKIAVNEANESIELINNLSDAANKIGNIVGLINSIASQTNLLALNATIEAARAGDAGRGFAVVAGEVKSLASQTAQATDEISNQVNTMQSATGIVVSTIERIAGTIGRINQIADEIQLSIQREEMSTVDIAQSVEHVARGTLKVSSNIQEVNTVVAQTSSAASQVLNSSQELNQQAHLLKKQIDDYLADVTEA